MSRREEIEEWLVDDNPEALFMDGFDDAIVGVVKRHTRETLVCYSYDKMVEKLISDGLTQEEAVEYISFNIECAYYGDHQPVILYEPLEWTPMPPMGERSSRNRFEVLEFSNIKDVGDGKEKSEEEENE